MTRFLVRWLQHAGQLLSEAVTGRRLSFALLLATLGAHLVCVWWVAGGGVAAAVRLEAYLPLAASGALAVAMFAMRRIVRVRAATIARAAAVLIAIALLDGPPVFVPALLVATLLIEPVLYDDDRVAMALGGAFFAAALAVLARGRRPDCPQPRTTWRRSHWSPVCPPAWGGWRRSIASGWSNSPRACAAWTPPSAAWPAPTGSSRRTPGRSSRRAQPDHPRAARHRRLRVDQHYRHDGCGEGPSTRGAGVPRLSPGRRARSERAGAERHATDPAPVAFRRAVRAQGDRRDLPTDASVPGCDAAVRRAARGQPAADAGAAHRFGAVPPRKRFPRTDYHVAGGRGDSGRRVGQRQRVAGGPNRPGRHRHVRNAGTVRGARRHHQGAQGNLWCDRIVSFETAGYQLFPRALALAEVAWSPRSQRDYRALTERIVTHLPRLAALQVNARYPDGIEFRYQDRMLTLEPELPGARVHFTLNGTVPSVADPVYAEPIPLPRPTLVRAAIVRHDAKLGRAKSFMACDLLDSGRLSVVVATDSDPSRPPPAVLEGTNWSFWLTAAERPPFPHEIAFDLGAEEEIAGFIYEPRTDGPVDGNVLAYELHVSAGAGSVMAASGSLNGRRAAQPVILDRPTRARTVTLRILDAAGGITAMSGFKLFHP